MFKYYAITQNIAVTVRSIYLEQKSNPIQNHFIFVYYVKIRNNSQQQLKIRRRQWLIKDNIGEVKEIGGEGVVGEQPVLNTGDEYTYQSYCILKSFSGSMEGFYLANMDQTETKIVIPRFYLKSHLLN